MKPSAFVQQFTELSKQFDTSFYKKFFVYDELASTNLKAKELAQNGAEEATVVIAQMQKKGRGRFERSWESPKGGIYCSLVIKPNVPLIKTQILPLLTALVVAKTVESFGLSPQIKWPNDVRVNKKKLAGILLESESKHNVVEYVVIGMGINTNTRLTDFPLEIQDQLTSLSLELQKTVDNKKMLITLLQLFQEYYTWFITGDEHRILEEWRRYSDTLGKKVLIQTTHETLAGTAVDVDCSGFLQIVTHTGKKQTIMSGDCLYCIDQ